MKNFRMTIYPAMEVTNKTVEFGFDTKQEMVASHGAVAGMLLFLQDEIGVMKDYSNCFLCEELVNGEWEEVEDDEDF